MLYKVTTYNDFKAVFNNIGTASKVIANATGTSGTDLVAQLLGITTTGDQVLCTINPGVGPTRTTVTADYASVIYYVGNNITV